MSKHNKPKKSQREQFIEKARELETVEDEAAFEAGLRRLAKAKPWPKRGRNREDKEK